MLDKSGAVPSLAAVEEKKFLQKFAWLNLATKNVAKCSKKWAVNKRKIHRDYYA